MITCNINNIYGSKINNNILYYNNMYISFNILYYINYKFTYFFSGNGFHIFVYVNQLFFL